MEKRSIEKTQAGFTQTYQGMIPHLKWRGILCPVKLQLEQGANGPKVRLGGVFSLPVACHDNQGRFVYALPGGGETV